MDVNRLRHALVEFLGADRYMRFVRQINRRKRFLAWHETMWAEFASAVPEFAFATFTEVQSAFSICELHGDELHPYLRRTYSQDIYYSPEFEAAWSALFPHAKHPIQSVDGKPIDDRFCPACCEAMLKWDSDNGISN